MQASASEPRPALPNMQVVTEPNLKPKVTAKIRSLYDCQLRLMHNLQPLPSGSDIANTVKYFSQTLLSVLKDVPNSPLEMLRDPSNDHQRMGLYPNLDYKGLFNAISQLVDSAPHIQYGVQTFGQAVLQCLGCLLPFLEYDMIDSLPYLVAYCVSVLPDTLHQDVLNLLCYYILPFTITRHYEGDDDESQASQSVAAIIMMVFQHSTNPAHHCQLLECLMTMKPTVVKDLLCVIAYGTSGARLSSAKLLFYYWPAFDAKLFDRKGLLCKFSNDLVPFLCQRDMCPNAGIAEAAKVCYDHCISVTFASDSPPPLYLCIECANEIHREHPNQRFFDILHPMQQVSMVCENKNCRSTDKAAYSICFSSECASFNGNHPIRYCSQCHTNRHNSRRGGDHVVHTRLPRAWQMDSDMQTHLVEAVISLLKEAKPLNIDDPDSSSEPLKPALMVNLPLDPFTIEDRQLLGRYGVWLMVGLCTPNPDTPDDILGRLLSVLFHWFHITSYAYTGETANTVEKLKNEHACPWLRIVSETHHDVLVGCLLPHPPEATKVGGHWDSLVSKTSHLKDGLNRLYCLIPYGIITQEIWDYIMPFWMEAIITDVPEKEMPELKVVVGKIMEPDISMVNVEEKHMYKFAAVKFQNTTPEEQIPALLWFQTLSLLEVKLPLGQLFEMFNQGVQKIPEHYKEKEEECPENWSNANNMTSCILMLDILLKQMELQQRRLQTQNVTSDATKLLRLMLKANQINNLPPTHCNSEAQCARCEASALWQQLAVQLVRTLMPARPKHPTQIMTATVETITEQLDMAVSLPATEQPPTATAHTVTLTDTDVATATADISTPNLLGDQDGIVDPVEGDMTNFWPTSVGKFHFCIEELPQELQYIHQLLQELKNTSRPDVLYQLLQCLQVLVLNADTLSDHRGFLIWCQENLLIENLWNVCDAKHSHICSVAVPILLHCVTLPAGADVLCGLLRDEFHSNNSTIRFTAVERVTVLIRFMDSTPLKNSLPLQTALATAFCYLISSMDDINVYVAQRSTLYIGTIHDNAVKLLLYCLETQFDLVIVDRPMVLQSIYQLHNTLSDRNILTWDFFLNRFEALFLEAQINSKKTIDFSNLRELVSTEASSETFLYKVRRAHEAITQSSRDSTVNTLSASFGTKWPYKRTISAPATVSMQHDSRHEREKVYSRQYSAPLLKRKTSRFGLGQLLAAGGGVPASIAGANLHRNPQSEDASSTVLPKTVDLEEADRETTNLLVFLLMQFLSRSDQAHPIEDKQAGKTQEIVLRHLFLLLGYNSVEKYFHMAPQILRQSSIFNAFMSNLPQVLDQNHIMGEHMIESTLLLLQYCASMPGSGGPGLTSGTLAALTPHVRHHWLMALLVVLYKYHYSGGTQCALVQSLVRVVLNSIEAQYHQCKRIPAMLVMYHQARSRDQSQPSLKTDHEPGPPPSGFDAPPSPLCVVDKTKPKLPILQKSPGHAMHTHWEEPNSTNKYQQWSVEQESSESELIAIPETSDKSDTTVHGSTAPGSFDEPSHYDEPSKIDPLMQPMTSHTHNKITVTGSRSNHQLSTSSSVSVGSDSSNLKSTPMSGQSVEIWPDQLHAPTSPRNKILGKQKRIIVGTSPSPDTGASSSEGHFAHWPTTPSTTDHYKSPVPTSAASPLSRMTLASPPRCTPPPHNTHPLHIPPTERLLPIGPQSTKEQYPVFNALVDRVREALSLHPEDSIDKTDSSKSDQEVPPRPHKLLTNKLSEGSCRSRGSPRRLARQAAQMGSPPELIHTQSEPNPDTSCPDAGDVPLDSGGAWWGTSPTGPGDRNDHTLHYRCSECGTVIEQYSDEELGLCVIVLATFIHREPAAAAPMLPSILHNVSRVVQLGNYSWQNETNIRLPGSAVAVAHQFLRCTLHQLAPNNVFLQLFIQRTPEKQRVMFFKSVAQAFVDFNELYPCGPLQLIVENLNSKKSLPVEQIPIIFGNMASYVECLAPEALGPHSACSSLLQQLDQLFRSLEPILQLLDDVVPILRLMTAALRIPGAASCKNILVPFSKIISYSIQNFVVRVSVISELSVQCVRVFTRERDRLLVCRVLVYELLQALRTKTTIPDDNFQVLLQFVLQGHGATLLLPGALQPRSLLSVGGDCRELGGGAVDCMRPHLSDLCDMLQDPHLLARIKGSVSRSIVNRNLVCLNEDTLGAIVKGGIAQYVALELALEGGKGKERGQLGRHLLPPLSSVLPGRELVECVSRVRLVSWLVVGALSCRGGNIPQPIPADATCVITDHIQTIMSSYVEAGKSAPGRMSSLCHAFQLCQLWTLYLQHLSMAHPPGSEGHNIPASMMLDLWCKVVPSVLQLTAHSKKLAESVNLQFLGLLESLLECNSTVLNKLLPLWTPVLYSPLFNINRASTGAKKDTR